MVYVVGNSWVYLDIDVKKRIIDIEKVFFLGFIY